jgi:hypothetical protein
MAEAQGDGIGLISIVCSALALTGTIAGLLCMGYGTLVGIPIAITGLILAIFATKHKKAAFILNSAALLPPALLAIAVTALGVGVFASFASITSCCCIAPAAIAPPVAVAQKGVAPIVNQAPTKRADLPPKQKAPILKNDDGAPIKEEPSETHLADRLYAQGKHEEAVKKYKGLFASAQKEEQAEMLRRIVDFEAGKGNVKEAQRWVESALDLELSPKYGTPAARELASQVQAEREQWAAQARKKREAEEAKLKAEQAAKKKLEREATAKKALADLQKGNAKAHREALEVADFRIFRRRSPGCPQCFPGMAARQPYRLLHQLQSGAGLDAAPG